mgnify:CR=1 FL=1
MAKYQATPFYEVQIDENKAVKFDFFGVYETDDKVELEALDKLVPTYIKCVDAEAKPKAARKTSAK